jgi:hypothetical protein
MTATVTTTRNPEAVIESENTTATSRTIRESREPGQHFFAVSRQPSFPCAMVNGPSNRSTPQ